MTPIFVNHHPALKERRGYLESALKNVTWITEPTKENITKKTKEEWYVDSKQEWIDKCSAFGLQGEHRTLKNGDLACSLGHIFAWEEFIESEQPYGIFFEDDIVVDCNDFETKIEEVIKKTPEDMDVLFIGGGFEHYQVSQTIETVDDVFHLKKTPNTNCACSYVLTREAARKLLEESKPFTMPIDFEMNYWFHKLKFKVYHHIPYFIKEGSKTGKYTSAQT